ncbi:S66 peptidase family protein [Carboxylicivirga linearis]|uniref:LD-carboxypeptidase n=1 Tax=Carboxylicivirga linearis TaxID=1628157 RepID=A0ABS5JTI2_9BACT|nr:LD-carboxypeptidase [Carboxylicivirga linearis]MBS2098190.1 LD-carboxypeptidase [Carboxylicivirga linearis]
MIFPKSLSKGSTVGIVSPAGKIDSETIHFAEKLLRSLGYSVVVGQHADNAYHQFAGNDEHRTSDLQLMLNRKDVEAIFCSRGGYGTARIIDKLDFSQFLEDPKWIIGYSDITVLHARLQNELKVASIHGPMPKNFPDKSKDDEDMMQLFKVLHGDLPTYKFKPHLLNRNGEAEGLLIGGNLSLIQTLRATPYDAEPHGKILFIEDVGEYLYSLDRMMQNLKLSGFLKQLSGLIVGQFTEMKDNNEKFGMSAYEIINEAVSEYDYPVIFGFPAGHGNINMPLVFGKRITISSCNCHSKIVF